MDVCNLKKILGSIVFGKETKGQSLSYMSEDQTGRQSQPQILSILLGCGETLTLIFLYSHPTPKDTAIIIL